MTGIIKSYDAVAKSGWIESETGDSIFFEASAVVAYDLPSVGMDRAVSFELRNARRPSAINISLSSQHPQRIATASRAGEMVFRYVGFHQGNACRIFQFEKICPGNETKTHNVSIDMALFAKHRLAIQEAPSLCSKLLQKPDELDRSEHALTEADLEAHAASRVVAPKKQVQRRKQVVVNPMPSWNMIVK